MNRLNAILQQQNNHIKDVLDRIGEISEDAEATDEAGRWGVDGWIRLIHDLIDMQIRFAATATEAVIEGPMWAHNRPYETDLLRAKRATPYERRYEIVDRFAAVGNRKLEIPEDLMEFDPPTLPPGQSRFRVRLKTTPRNQVAAFQGANYEGRIWLRPVDPNVAPTRLQDPPQKFVVGL
jgi:hypothetical protein